MKSLYLILGKRPVSNSIMKSRNIKILKIFTYYCGSGVALAVAVNGASIDQVQLMQKPPVDDSTLSGEHLWCLTFKLLSKRLDT